MIGDGTDIPCVNEEGMVIYRTQFWSPDANADDDPMPVIANIEEIRKAKKSTASRYAAAKSTTERKEPEEQGDWERESHADDYKRDAENAIRGMDIETDGFWRDI